MSAANATCPLVPCATCPWRRDSAGGSAIPGFDIEKARGLANTVGHGDDFRPIMACHGSTEGDERPCVGYLAREGWTNHAVRVAAIDGRVPLDRIMDACDGIDLHDDFDSMLGALELAEELRAET